MIHKYKMNNYNIVLDCNSGAVHVVDDITYDILDFYKSCNLDEIKEKLSDRYDINLIEESYNEVKELEKEGMLFTEDDYEEVLKFVNNRKPVIKALCLHIAHDCNLKCKYCFAEEGEYKGKRSLMSLEVGK